MGVPGVIKKIGGVVVRAAGGAVLGQSAMSLLESRRDQAPKPPPGMPPVPRVINPLRHPIEYAANIAEQEWEGVKSWAGIVPGTGGLGAVKPHKKDITTHRCPKGYALAIDGQCYPKSMLPRQMRRWKPEPKPVVSRSDQKAIRRAAGAKARLVKITKASGAWASLHKPGGKGGLGKPGHGSGCKCVACRTGK